MGEVRVEKSTLRVRELRKRAGMTQKALADATGLCQSAISRIERGQRDVSLATLSAIARALGVPVKSLLD